MQKQEEEESMGGKKVLKRGHFLFGTRKVWRTFFISPAFQSQIPPPKDV